MFILLFGDITIYTEIYLKYKMVLLSKEIAWVQLYGITNEPQHTQYLWEKCMALNKVESDDEGTSLIELSAYLPPYVVATGRDPPTSLAPPFDGQCVVFLFGS